MYAIGQSKSFLKQQALKKTGRKKPLPYPNTFEDSEMMRKYQRQNVSRSRYNPNENWMAEKLAVTGLKWTRQAMWGKRIFDFWCAEIGVVIEVDGPEHKKAYDQSRDAYNYARSGIIVLRVRNKNEADAATVLEIIPCVISWLERREEMGILTPSQAATLNEKRESEYEKMKSEIDHLKSCVPLEKDKNMTRQAIWQAKRRAAGICTICGKEQTLQYVAE